MERHLHLLNVAHAFSSRRSALGTDFAPGMRAGFTLSIDGSA